MSGADALLTEGYQWLAQGRHDEAARCFGEAVALSPGLVDARYGLASIAETHHRIGETIEHTRAIVEIQPGSAEAHHNLGRLLQGDGQAPEAISSFREAVRLAPERGIVHFDLGLALLGQRLATEAIDAFERAMALGHDSAETRYCLAVALMTAGDAAGAADHFERLVAGGYGPATLHFHLGAALLSLGRTVDAIRHLREAVRQDGARAEYHLNLGQALEGEGDLEGATSAYESANALRPSPEHSLRLGTAHQRLRHLSRAALAFRRAIEMAPDSGEAHFRLGLCLLEDGLAADAVAAIQRAIQLGHDSHDVRYSLGVALLSGGDTAGAAGTFQGLLTAGFESAAFSFHHGVAQVSLGRTVDGIRHLRDAVHCDRSRAEYQWHLGLALESQGGVDEAASWYASAVKVEPTAGRCLRLGLARQQLGQLSLASEAFRQATDLAPDCAEAHYRLGYVQALQHHLADAIASCRTAIALDPGWHNRHILLTVLLKREQEVVAHLLPTIADPLLKAMIVNLIRAPKIFHPSKYWLFHMMLNIGQLQGDGIEHFKRTVNTNYFNFVLTGIADQVQDLRALIEQRPASRAVESGAFDDSLIRYPATWTEDEREQYKQFLMLLWTYATSIDGRGLLSRLSEPLLGDPITIRARALDVSQDLCNSVVEANAILRCVPVPSPGPLRIAELGAGYGRLSWVLLAAVANARVTIIDIPPALYVAQWYYSRLLPGDRVFKYREFASYDEIRQEFERASVAFLLASQVELLPAHAFDLFINVASLQEMTMPQVRMWYNQIDRLCSGYFYSKQHVTSTNDLDEVCMRQEDYPVKAHWRELFSRRCEVQRGFFESLFSLAR